MRGHIGDVLFSLDSNAFAFLLLLRRLMEKAFKIYCLGLFVLTYMSTAGKGTQKGCSWNVLIRDFR